MFSKLSYVLWLWNANRRRRTGKNDRKSKEKIIQQQSEFRKAEEKPIAA